jgi:hypothetical protein
MEAGVSIGTEDTPAKDEVEERHERGSARLFTSAVQ